MPEFRSEFYSRKSQKLKQSRGEQTLLIQLQVWQLLGAEGCCTSTVNVKVYKSWLMQHFLTSLSLHSWETLRRTFKIHSSASSIPFLLFPDFNGCAYDGKRLEINTLVTKYSIIVNNCITSFNTVISSRQNSGQPGGASAFPYHQQQWSTESSPANLSPHSYLQIQ